MFKKRTVTFFLFLVLASTLFLTSCDSPKEADAPAAKPNVPVASTEVIFGDGLTHVEGDKNITWRWMSTEGLVKLKNSTKDMKLTLTGNVPMSAFPQPPTLTIFFNGKQLDQFPGAQNVAKEYTIPAADQAGKEFSELKITTNKTFVPKEVDKKSSDDRKLGFSVTKVDWVAK
jgi:hypothetical protein